jgi:hypothetical protein
MQQKINILIPLYNDWEALRLLLIKIKQETRLIDAQFRFSIVNDCSSKPFNAEDFREYTLEIIHLMRNVGHQKAIALGLSYLAEKGGFDKVIVMDSDGEDRPEDIAKLIEKSVEEPHKIVFAQRNKRSEGLAFVLFYYVYRWVFGLLTGKKISFGNFSLIPFSLIKKLTFVSEIWNNYPGGIIRSKLPYTSVISDRGSRLAGKSQMNFVSLILHGMSTISVFLDITAVRILLLCLLMILFSSIGIITVLTLKLIFSMASPGWASSLASAFFIIALQGFFISLFMVFIVLSYRSNKHFIPLLDYKNFIESIEEISSR